MSFPAKELLQVALGSCVAMAVVILMREVVALGRKLRANARSRPSSDGSPAVLNLPALETEVE